MVAQIQLIAGCQILFPLNVIPANAIESKGVAEKGLMYSAFDNPDGTVAFVLLNEGTKEVRLTVTDGKNCVDCVVPAKSVASYRWKK